MLDSKRAEPTFAMPRVQTKRKEKNASRGVKDVSDNFQCTLCMKAIDQKEVEEHFRGHHNITKVSQGG